MANHSLEMAYATQDIAYANDVLSRLNNPHCYQAVLAEQAKAAAVVRYEAAETALKRERANREG